MDRKAVPLLTSAGPVLESPTPGLDLFTFRDQNCPAFAVACTYDGNEERSALLPDWLHSYNFHRAHTSLGGLPPISRVNDVRGNYT